MVCFSKVLLTKQGWNPRRLMRLFKRPETPYRIATTLLTIAFFGVATVFAYVGSDVWSRYEAYRERETVYRTELVNLRETHAQQATYLKKLLEDPDFFEKTVRERLGWSRQGEILIRFESGSDTLRLPQD